MVHDFYFSRGKMVRIQYNLLSVILKGFLSKFSMRTPHLAHYPKVFDTHTLSCSEYCSDPNFNCKIDLANWSPQLRFVFKSAKSIS